MGPHYVTPAPPSPQPEPPAAPVARTYRVVGPRAVGGAEPGETVELTLTEGQEAALIEAGHIARVSKKTQARGPERAQEREQ